MAYKRLATRKPGFAARQVEDIVYLMGVVFDGDLAAIPEVADTALQSGRAVSFVVADLVTAILNVRPDAEPGRWPT